MRMRMLLVLIVDLLRRSGVLGVVIVSSLFFLLFLMGMMGFGMGK